MVDSKKHASSGNVVHETARCAAVAVRQMPRLWNSQTMTSTAAAALHVIIFVPRGSRNKPPAACRRQSSASMITSRTSAHGMPERGEVRHFI